MNPDLSNPAGWAGVYYEGRVLSMMEDTEIINVVKVRVCTRMRACRGGAQVAQVRSMVKSMLGLALPASLFNSNFNLDSHPTPNCSHIHL